MMVLECTTCHQKFNYEKGLYYCKKCGPLRGTLSVVLQMDKYSIKQSQFSSRAPMYQFASLLPVKNYSLVEEAVGGTPLLVFENTLGLKWLAIKNDGMNLSASYKDRASLVAVNMAIKEEYETIFCASTGNAASSLALLAASSPLTTVIFVPKYIPKGKLAQLKASGVKLELFNGDYDATFDYSMEVGLKKGWYCRNSAINPFNLEGKKTAAYEILVQMAYEVPDFCLVSVGDGRIISSLIKGFEEFYTLGLVNKIPKVIGVQSDRAQTLKKVFDSGEPYYELREKAQSLADSISVGYPRDLVKACYYLKRNGGYIVCVPDDAILEAVCDMTATTGVFAEPAGAAPLAGLKLLMKQDLIQNHHKVVLVVTGNGLKDTKNLGGNR